MYPTRVAPNDHNLWPVMDMSFSRKTSHKILPHGFWNFQIQQTRVSLVRFNLSLAESADGALYGRRHQPPTITRHDFVIKIEKHALRKRQVYSSATVSDCYLAWFWPFYFLPALGNSYNCTKFLESLVLNMFHSFRLVFGYNYGLHVIKHNCDIMTLNIYMPKIRGYFKEIGLTIWCNVNNYKLIFKVLIKSMFLLDTGNFYSHKSWWNGRRGMGEMVVSDFKNSIPLATGNVILAIK